MTTSGRRMWWYGWIAFSRSIVGRGRALSSFRCCRFRNAPFATCSPLWSGLLPICAFIFLLNWELSWFVTGWKPIWFSWSSSRYTRIRCVSAGDGTTGPDSGRFAVESSCPPLRRRACCRLHVPACRQWRRPFSRNSAPPGKTTATKGVPWLSVRPGFGKGKLVPERHRHGDHGVRIHLRGRRLTNMEPLQDSRILLRASIPKRVQVTCSKPGFRLVARDRRLLRGAVERANRDRLRPHALAPKTRYKPRRSLWEL